MQRTRRTTLVVLAAGSLALVGIGRPLFRAGDSPTGPDPFPTATTGGDAQTPAMAELGARIFGDTNLSIRRNQSCAACHGAAYGFTGPDEALNRAGSVYEGSIPGRFGARKPPSSAYATLSPVFHLSREARGRFVGGNFWDGRATGEKVGSAAADQAQGPPLNPVEQALRDEACVVYRVAFTRDRAYAAQYRRVFGSDVDRIRFPEGIDAQCGQEGPRFEIDRANRAMISKEYDNIARAIAAHEATTNRFSSRFDAWRKGTYRPSRQEQRGFALFQGKAGCAKCHTSTGERPEFTDHTFDNLGVPRNPADPVYAREPAFVDEGLGGFLATRPEWRAYAAEERGKMRVPTLRNVDLRPRPDAVKAYMHNGVFKSLDEVVHFYNTRDVLARCPSGTTREDPAWGVTCWPAPEVTENVNTTEVGHLGLTSEEEANLVAFLKTLSDGYTPGAMR